MSGDESVNVALRVRPLVRSEIERGCQVAIVRTANGAPQVTVNSAGSFTYNYVFDSTDSQESIYKTCVLPKLKRLLAGFNVTILAYGQTGSGKTYTMGTAFNGEIDDDVGVIPRAVDDIFRNVVEMSEEYEFVVSCSFVELYQEQFFDLLSANTRENRSLEIREDKTGIKMPGLTEILVQSAKDVTDQLMRGSAGRAVASTAMNEQSSRSHAIFTITVVATKKDGKKSVTTSRFNLVDLAGSERCSKTQATGDRFKEGVNINKGLLALGNVINALGSNQNFGYVPYRQSKLTRLLQDSLGGNSITLMIACVSPADYNVQETMSTLRYADRALEIKNKPIMNVDPHAAEVNRLKEIIQKLRMELLLRGGAMSSSLASEMSNMGMEALANSSSSQAELQRLLHRVKQLEEAHMLKDKKCDMLQKELQRSLHDLAEYEMRGHMIEVTHDKMGTGFNELKAAMNSCLGLVVDGQCTDSEQWAKGMHEVSELVHSMDREHRQMGSELEAHRKEFLTNGHMAIDDEVNAASTESQNDEVRELLQSHGEQYTKKQLDLKEELRDINRQLDLKQELHERVCHNFNKMNELNALDGVSEEKVRDNELIIKELESERNELLDQLRHAKKDTSAKLAEERRKRLQMLELQIADLRRKLVNQAKMLRMREKETDKINSLSSEIRLMKESKVKLIRAMRGESEKFRQWKMAREKEITQLKSKDRKMQGELVRQKEMNMKKNMVLQRKCEEAQAINKRLKDALDRQTTAQRPNKDNAAAKIAWVDQELDVILSLIDAEHSLEQLMEDRAVINTRINELKQQGDDVAQKELGMLVEELEMRNAQIADLQQKVCVKDLESRTRALTDGVMHIAEARTISKRLIKSLVQLRREHAQVSADREQRLMEQNVALQEQRTQLSDRDKRYELLSKRMRQTEVEHLEAMAEHRRAYEEKVTMLLNADTDNESEALQDLFEKKLLKLDEMTEELQAFKEDFVKKSKTKYQPQPKADQLMDQTAGFLNDTLGSHSSDSDADPDWVPYSKRTSKTHSLNRSGEPANNTNTTNTANMSDVSNDATIASTSANGQLRKVRVCKCRNKCDTKRCGCNSSGQPCTLNCMCKTVCQNPIRPSDDHEDAAGNETAASALPLASEVKENATSSPNNSVCNETITLGPGSEPVSALSGDATNRRTDVPATGGKAAAPPFINATYDTPKLARFSTLNFDTPSSKQKFF